MRAILRDSQDGLGILRKNRIIGTCERRFWESFSITTLRLQLQDQVFLIVCPTRSDGSGKQAPNQEHVQGYYITGNHPRTAPKKSVNPRKPQRKSATAETKRAPSKCPCT
jgi:hypothetical protein